MDSGISLVTSFVRLHYHLEKGDLLAYLTPNFVFDDGLENIPREEYLALQPGIGTVERFAIHDIIVSDERAAVMFEGFDAITGLFHRYCWLLTLDGKQVSRVSACVANLISPEERPVLARKTL
jgi:hypothetical protein